MPLKVATISESHYLNSSILIILPLINGRTTSIRDGNISNFYDDHLFDWVIDGIVSLMQNKVSIRSDLHRSQYFLHYLYDRYRYGMNVSDMSR